MRKILLTGLLLLSLTTFNSCSPDELSDYDKIEYYEIQKGKEKGIYPLPKDFYVKTVKNIQFDSNNRTLTFEKDGLNYLFRISLYSKFKLDNNYKVLHYDNGVQLDDLYFTFESPNNLTYIGYYTNKVIITDNDGYVVMFKQY